MLETKLADSIAKFTPNFGLPNYSISSQVSCTKRILWNKGFKTITRQEPVEYLELELDCGHKQVVRKQNFVMSVAFCETCYKNGYLTD